MIMTIDIKLMEPSKARQYQCVSIIAHEHMSHPQQLQQSGRGNGGVVKPAKKENPRKSSAAEDVPNIKPHPPNGSKVVVPGVERSFKLFPELCYL